MCWISRTKLLANLLGGAFRHALLKPLFNSTQTCICHTPAKGAYERKSKFEIILNWIECKCQNTCLLKKCVKCQFDAVANQFNKSKVDVASNERAFADLDRQADSQHRRRRRGLAFTAYGLWQHRAKCRRVSAEDGGGVKTKCCRTVVQCNFWFFVLYFHK